MLHSCWFPLLILSNFDNLFFKGGKISSPDLNCQLSFTDVFKWNLIFGQMEIKHGGSFPRQITTNNDGDKLTKPVPSFLSSSLISSSSSLSITLALFFLMDTLTGESTSLMGEEFFCFRGDFVFTFFSGVGFLDFSTFLSFLFSLPKMKHPMVLNYFNFYKIGALQHPNKSIKLRSINKT